MACSRPTRIWQRIEKVTVADVNRVARQYLNLDQAVAGRDAAAGLGHAGRLRGGGFGGQESISLGEAKPTPLPDWAQAALNRLTVPPSTLASGRQHTCPTALR